jgi:hypothetical protein
VWHPFPGVKEFWAILNQHAQDFQAAYMITKHFFFPFAPS